MPTASGFTTLEGIRAQLRIEAGDVGDDSLLTQMGKDATAEMIAYLGYDPNSTAYTERYHGKDKDRFTLRFTPVISITTLKVNENAVSAALDSNSSGYMFDPDTGTVYAIGGIFPRGVRNILVVYTAGYATIPADIVRACSEQVAYAYLSRERTGLRSMNIAQQTQVYETGHLLERVQGVLDRYKRIVVG
jgi:hypothetical protein